MRTLLALVGALAWAAELPVNRKVEHQPLAAQAQRVVEALALLGDPLPQEDERPLRQALSAAGTVEAIQRVLDRYCLAGVHINPESRVSVTQGPAPAVLAEQGWRTFLIKVYNEAGVTAVLAVDSPNAGPLANRPEGALARRWMDIQMFNRQPLRPHLSGLEVEYRIVQLYARERGKREGKLIFDVGQGTQDLGFRSEIDILFSVLPAAKITFRVREGQMPSIASFIVRDARGRVYPSQAKRLAPDFFFHPQVYRADGESLMLPDGDYTVEYGRGPEYRAGRLTVRVEGKDREVDIRLERWIDPARWGWISGDHHIHAAGCAHYEKPTEGVYPRDMMRHVLGEDLKIGSVLSWGPGWYFQKTFFEGKDHELSTPRHRMHYDVEVSGFPSSHTGHLVLLGLSEQDYPNTRRIEDWPSWGMPVLRWAKKQNAVTGYAHSGWGLAIRDGKLPSLELPAFDGIGANEYIASVAHGLVDFISAVDTPYPWELNIWYHTLNAGFRTRMSGETDFPCIYDDRVGLGRSYVRQKAARISYQDWIEGIREGRSYVSDGRSHLMDFSVSGQAVGEAASQVELSRPGKVGVRVRAAALLAEQPDQKLRSLSWEQKPYWDLERARIGRSRSVPVELVVNGQAVQRKELVADGVIRELTFEQQIAVSSWVAVRILPSSHTNPVFVIVDGQPIRASKGSIQWCLDAVERCWRQKAPLIRPAERLQAEAAYQEAAEIYRKRLAEAVAP
jgi:hypothetical protein